MKLFSKNSSFSETPVLSVELYDTIVASSETKYKTEVVLSLNPNENVIPLTEFFKIKNIEYVTDDENKPTKIYLGAGDHMVLVDELNEQTQEQSTGCTPSG